jgi:hypothetical protein
MRRGQTHKMRLSGTTKLLIPVKKNMMEEMAVPGPEPFMSPALAPCRNAG